MTRLSMAAVLAVAILAAGGGILYIGSQRSSSVVAPTPSVAPSPVPSATGASAGAIPPELAYMWVGPKRTVPDKPSFDRYRFRLTTQTLTFPDDNFASAWFTSSASAPAPGQLRLVATGSTQGCQNGDEGLYSWSLSPGGVRLRLISVSDACRNRSTALAGDWIRVACRNPDSGCIGDLEAGTFSSQYVAPRLPATASWSPDWGALSYTVPAGWANSADWPNHLSLTPSEAYAKEGPDGPSDGIQEIDVFRLPAAIGQDPACTDTVLTGVPSTVDGLLGHIRGLDSVATTTPKPITIDGHAGTWLDLAVAPTWTGTCPGSPSRTPVAVLFGNEASVGSDSYGVGLTGSERERLILVDVGGQVVAIVIDATDPSTFDTFASQAMSIVESFRFK